MPESDNNSIPGNGNKEPESSTSSEKNQSNLLWLPVSLIVFGFLIRLVALFSSESIGVDSVRYLTFARNYISGTFYSIGPTGLKEFPDIGYPLLIALGTKIFGGDVETVARWISLIAGTLTLILIYMFALRAAGFKPAIYALFLSSVCPPLVSYSSLVQTESLFIFVLATVAYLSYAATQRGYNTFWFMISGICVAYAYLTRGIGISFLIMFPLSVWLVSRYEGAFKLDKIRYKFTLGLILFIVGFVIIALPYQIMLFRTYDRFVLSDQSIWHTPRMAHPEIDFSPDPRYDGILTSDKTDYLINTSEYFNYKPSPVFTRIKSYVSKYIKNQIGIYYYHLRELYPPLFLFFIAIGLFSERWSTHFKKLMITFGIWSLPFLILQPFYYTEARYIAPVTIFLMVVAGIGAYRTSAFLKDSFSRFNPSKLESGFAVVLFIILTPMMIYPLTHKGPKYAYRDLRDAGSFLAGYKNPESGGVFAVTPVTGYYADINPNLVLPRDDINTIIRFAHLKGIEFIILTERKVHINRPELRNILYSDNFPSQLKLIYDNDDQIGFKVRIFQIKPLEIELNDEIPPPFFDKGVNK